jgi:hypothetical protein
MLAQETGAAMKATAAADTTEVVLPRWPPSCLIQA